MQHPGSLRTTHNRDSEEPRRTQMDRHTGRRDGGGGPAAPAASGRRAGWRTSYPAWRRAASPRRAASAGSGAPSPTTAAATCWRPDLLPLTVGGIFVGSYETDAPDFFARPSPSVARRAAGGGRLESFVRMNENDYMEIVDCCNGLLLLEGHDVVAANPATRRSARLPPCDGVLPDGHEGVGLYWSYLAFDPAVSPHYEVISMQHPFNGEPLQGLQWPPPAYVMRAYSSRTGRWEERRFALDDDGEGCTRSIDGESVRASGHAAYWRGVLYVHCNSHFILRFVDHLHSLNYLLF